MPDRRENAAERQRPVKSRVFLVDDHPVVREGLTALIDCEPDLHVCGAASSAEEALPAIRRLRPRVAIVDLSLDGRSGLELVAALRSACPGVAVLVLSVHDELLFAERCLQAGARGYLMKEQTIGEILAAVRQLLAGKVYLSGPMTERLLERVAGGHPPTSSVPIAALSEREREVFLLIGRGLGTAEIAGRLNLSVKTIESHRIAIKQKLNLKTGMELVRCAVGWSEGL